MKKLKMPEVIYTFYDSSLISKTLDSNQKSKAKQGNTIRTLAGMFKLIRIMPLFGGLGDYVILAACVDWMKNNKQVFTSKEIRRCFNYFEDYNPREVFNYRALTEQLAPSPDPLLSLKTAPNKGDNTPNAPLSTLPSSILKLGTKS